MRTVQLDGCQVPYPEASFHQWIAKSNSDGDIDVYGIVEFVNGQIRVIHHSCITFKV